MEKSNRNNTKGTSVPKKPASHNTDYENRMRQQQRASKESLDRANFVSLYSMITS